MSETPDLAPDGAVWVCTVCSETNRSRARLLSLGCRYNVTLCVDDKPKGVYGDRYYWRLYEPRP